MNIYLGFEKPSLMPVQTLGLLNVGLYASTDYLQQFGGPSSENLNQHRFLYCRSAPILKDLTMKGSQTWCIESSELTLSLAQAGFGLLYWFKSDPRLAALKLVAIDSINLQPPNFGALYLSASAHVWETPVVRYWLEHLTQQLTSKSG